MVVTPVTTVKVQQKVIFYSYLVSYCITITVNNISVCALIRQLKQTLKVTQKLLLYA